MVTFKKKSHAKRDNVENVVNKLASLDFLIEAPFPFLKGEQKEFLAKQVHPQMVQWITQPESVMEGWPESLDPAIDVKLHSDRAMRKRQQIVAGFRAAFEGGLLYQLYKQQISKLHNDDAHEFGLVVVDFGCGSGHLGLLFAWALPKLVKKVILLDTKEVGLEKANARAAQLGISDRVVTMQEDTGSWFSMNHESGKLECCPPFHFDLAISLHSCGSLTDLALGASYSLNAAFCLIPCCYGQLQSTKYPASAPMNRMITRPQSSEFQSNDLDLSTFDTLASAADFSLSNNGKSETWEFSTQDNYGVAKLAMQMVDLDRLYHTKSQGSYQYVWQCTLQPLHCTPKNNVICGLPQSNLGNGRWPSDFQHLIASVSLRTSREEHPQCVVTLEDVLSVPHLGQALLRFLPADGLTTGLANTSRRITNLVRSSTIKIELRGAVTPKIANSLLQELGSLVVLDLHGCFFLDSVPESIQLLRRTLRVLELRENGQMVRETPKHERLFPGKVVGNLTNLVGLDLSSCRLTGLSDSIGKLTKLKRLRIGDNPGIVRFPTVISKLQELDGLSIVNTGIVNIPSWLKLRCPKLKGIQYNNIQVSSGESNQGSCDLLENLPRNIETLEFTWNNGFQIFTHDPSKTFALDALRYLHLTSSIPDGVIPEQLHKIASQLKELRIDCNPIRHLPEWFDSETGFCNLEVLYLNGTLLEIDFADRIRNLIHLKVANLSISLDAPFQESKVPPWSTWKALKWLSVNYWLLESYELQDDELHLLELHVTDSGTNSVCEACVHDYPKTCSDSVRNWFNKNIKQGMESLKVPLYIGMEFQRCYTLQNISLFVLPEATGIALDSFCDWSQVGKFQLFGCHQEQLTGIVYTPELLVAEFYSCTLDECPRFLNTCGKLRALRFFNCDTLSQPLVGSSVLRCLSENLVDLNDLVILDCGLQCDDFDWLSKMTQLRTLSLSGNSFTGFKLSYLSTLVDLHGFIGDGLTESIGWVDLDLS